MTTRLATLGVMTATLVASLGGSAYATLIVYEPFDYAQVDFLSDTSTSTASSGTGSGTQTALEATRPIGFLAPNFNNWYGAGMGTANYASANDGQVTNSDLTVAGLAKPSSTTKALSLGDQGYTFRLSLNSSTSSSKNQITTNLTDAADNTGYYSLALKVTDITSLNGIGGTLAGFNVFIGGQTGNPNTTGAGLTIRPVTAGSTFNLGVIKSSASSFASATWDSTVYNLNDTIFVVGKYQTVGGPASATPQPTDDIASLWINPSSSTFGASDPAGALTNSVGPDLSTNASTNNHTLQSFMLRQNGTSTNNQIPKGIIYDELRIGTTYADVTPLAVPEAGSFLLVGLVGVVLGVVRFRRSNPVVRV